MTLNASEVEVPGGKLYQAGETCEGKPGSVYVMVWTSPAAPQSDGVLQTKKEIDVAKGYEDTCNPDCNSGVLLENDQLVTVAFLQKGATPNVLQPPQSVISALTKQVAAAATTTLPTTATSTPTTATTAKPATGKTVTASTAAKGAAEGNKPTTSAKATPATAAPTTKKK
jgi:hypothetical protein